MSQPLSRSDPFRVSFLTRPWLLRAIVLMAVVVSVGATIAAMRQTSATFDEIAVLGAGARGYDSGSWDLIPGYPPVTQYLYGLPVHLSQPNHPEEFERVSPNRYAYDYAKQLLWRSGNDGQLLIFRARLLAAAFALALLVLVFFYTRAVFGENEAVLATILVAFLPDVMAHGGVAYNDLPLAFGYLLSLVATDAALRRPSVRSGALAGLALAFAFAIKLSAIAAVVCAGALFYLEAVRRTGDRAWWKSVISAGAVGMTVLVVALGILYRGELGVFINSLFAMFAQATGGLGQGAYLLGQRSDKGWWYFFPVVFVFKTPVAFQILVLLGIIGYGTSLRARATARQTNPGATRALIIGLGVFVIFLLASTLNLGFRYALPALPLLSILVAAGLIEIIRQRGRVILVVVIVLLAAHAGSSLAAYPFFLSYASEWAPRGRADRVFVDSNLDWGQGLLALRDFQLLNNTGPVYLAYHGSALPAAYGIEYSPWPSYHELQPQVVSQTPRYAVISATLLHGLKVKGDPYQAFRKRRPDHIVGGSLFVYKMPPR